MKSASTDAGSASFQAYLAHLRDDSFSMIERVRLVQRGERDGLSMRDRLRLLTEVGTTAAKIAAEIELLYVAVLLPADGTPDEATPEPSLAAVS